MPKKTRRKTPVKQTQLATSLPSIHPDATLGPESALEATGDYWVGRETTSAPNVGEKDKDETQGEFAKGSAELFDKFLHGKVNITPKTVWLILTILWFGFISWLYLQDNQLNRISDISGLKWFGVKSGFYTAAYLLVSAAIYFFARKK